MNEFVIILENINKPVYKARLKGNPATTIKLKYAQKYSKISSARTALTNLGIAYPNKFKNAEIKPYKKDLL